MPEQLREVNHNALSHQTTAVKKWPQQGTPLPHEARQNYRHIYYSIFLNIYQKNFTLIKVKLLIAALVR